MNELIVSTSPHIRAKTDTRAIMLDVIIALVPAFAAAVFSFGVRSLLIVAVCVGTALLSEFLFQKGCKKPVMVGDLSAVVTGLLLAYSLPASIPLWQAAFGSVVAIVVVKQLFGGIGQNFANPAVTARIVMLLAFSATMTNWTMPLTADAVSGATPLELISAGNVSELPKLKDMLLGLHSGCIGETGTLPLLLGGLYLLARRVISWHTPVVFIATVFGITAAFGAMPVYQIMSGSLILGAFFMATDYSTTPSTALGKVIFGFGAGALTALIRVFGSYPEGVSFAILLMNILTPHISRLTRYKPLGGAKV
jgi:electron transport complex protein RnfD